MTQSVVCMRKLPAQVQVKLKVNQVISHSCITSIEGSPTLQWVWLEPASVFTNVWHKHLHCTWYYIHKQHLLRITLEIDFHTAISPPSKYGPTCMIKRANHSCPCFKISLTERLVDVPKEFPTETRCVKASSCFWPFESSLATNVWHVSVESLLQ